MDIQSIDETSLLKLLAEGGASSDSSSIFSSLTGSSDSGSANETDFAKILIAQLDSDGNGEVSSPELRAGANKVKSALSQLNGISSQMRASSAQSQTSAATLMSQLGKSGNASLDITDTGLSQVEFAKIDSDADGQITAVELQSVIDKAAGKSSASKLSASKEECVSILDELQAKSLVKQYETLKSAAEKAA